MFTLFLMIHLRLGAGDNQAADETTAPVAHATAEEPFAAAFCASLNLANLVLGESIHVVCYVILLVPFYSVESVWLLHATFSLRMLTRLI